MSSIFHGLNRLYFDIMLDYNEVTVHKYIIYENEPWEVVGSHVFRKQQRKPVNATKLRNLITGRITEVSFHVSDKVEEAEIDKKEVKYLYTNKGEFWFCEANDPSKRFQLSEEMIGSGAKFLKPNIMMDTMLFDDKIIGIKLPIKMELKVIEAHDATKGNTAQGATKSVKLETGVEIQVPMFIKEGDIVRINTDTGEYADRVS
ncbi:MAG: Elongation factor P [Parcubacteria group bacterium GW2011_GWB1_38_8]|nr:MAG: Elongation factor P [Parcubacteria group bacterium GW2011_GWB1_38_8]